LTSSIAQVSSIATGEAATCWIVRVGDTQHASNAGSGTPSDSPDEPLALLGTVATDSGTVDAAASSDGTLTRVGSVTVLCAVGGEGIVAV
jgi:hypothetical protein